MTAAALELRGEASTAPILVGRFCPFDSWTLISSPHEGRFRERFRRGAFARTIADRGDRIRLLHEHGRDPTTGGKPLGKVLSITERDDGATVEAELFHEAAYVRELLPAIRAGALQMSFRFSAVREDYGEGADGVPERTIVEAKLAEVSTVTWPAYEQTTVGLRSADDLARLRGLPNDYLVRVHRAVTGGPLSDTTAEDRQTFARLCELTPEQIDALAA